MKAHIHVFGTSHLLQYQNPVGFDLKHIWEFHRGKNHYTEELLMIILQHQITHISEEAHATSPTIAQAISSGEGLCYTPIDMPAAERKRQGISTLPNTNGIVDPHDPAVIASNEIREKYMFDRIREQISSDTQMLVICGDRHVESLCRLIGESEIDSTPYRIREYSWFKRIYAYGS